VLFLSSYFVKIFIEMDAYGIYKKLSNHHLQQLYIEARQVMSNDIQEAKRILRQAIEDGTNQSLHSDVNVLKIILRELDLYRQINSSDVTQLDFTQIVNRPISIWREGWNQFPQSVFYLRTKLTEKIPILFVGRKLLSNVYIENKIPELHCSQIRPTMLLGIFSHTHSSQSAVTIHFYPLEESEKQFIFNFIAQNLDKTNTEIIYPFSLLHPDTHQELCSEPDGWLFTEEMVDELAQGETHLRNYTIEMISRGKLKVSTNSLIYDPACSTGKFLSTIKSSFPHINTIGQDLSKSMIDYVRQHKHADETIHSDATNWPLGDRQVDLAFIRFLNSEVVTTQMAFVLFEKIVDRIKSNGQIVLFGHTPLLLSSSNFLSIRNSLKIEQCIGVSNDSHGITLFQYYIIKKCV